MRERKKHDLKLGKWRRKKGRSKGRRRRCE